MMTSDNTPHRIFKISELTRAIASQLVLIGHKNLVNLACTSRYFEEPVLSTLWKTQASLYTLLEVLPRETWVSEDAGHNRRVFKIVGDPSPEAWSRTWRYASWMRKACVDGNLILGEGTLPKIRSNSPPGGWFPALQDYHWWIAERNIPYADLFLSPHLKKVWVSLTYASSRVSCNLLPAIASTISSLPTSALQLVFTDLTLDGVPRTYFKDSLSSVALRCGSSLTEFSSETPLSDEAVNHLIQLPNLRIIYIGSPPPNYSTSSLPLVFSPLADLTLGKDAVHGWLSLFERLENRVPTTQDVTPLFKLKESLKSLSVEHPPGLTIDHSFTSSIQIYRNLVDLNAMVCCREGPGSQCTFKSDNDNITELAMALPRLKSLVFGYPCSGNTCATTVACLLPISVHCLRLEKLSIHFNTTNVVDGFKNLSEDPRFQVLRSLPRCILWCLQIHRIPLNFDEPGSETVINGIADLFPSLRLIEGFERIWKWEDLSGRVAELRET